mgnify:CR=1 FL=1
MTTFETTLGDLITALYDALQEDFENDSETCVAIALMLQQITGNVQ